MESVGPDPDPAGGPGELSVGRHACPEVEDSRFGVIVSDFAEQRVPGGDAFGLILWVQAAVELLATAVVRLGREHYLRALRAGRCDRELQFRTQIGVELWGRRRGSIRPLSIRSMVSQRPTRISATSGSSTAMARRHRSGQAWQSRATTSYVCPKYR